MIRIGFVDHYLNNFHATKFLSLLRGPVAGEGVEVVCAWESSPTGEDWCAKNEIPRESSARAVADRCDAVMVLAPNTIEAHPDLCAEVIPAGKPTLVDKLLATRAEDGKQILDLAEKHGAPLFSASGLRFAVELQDVLSPGDSPESIFARGMGEWDHYGMHTLSMVMALKNRPVTRLIETGSGRATVVTLEYEDGDRAVVEVRSASNMWETLPWVAGWNVGEKSVVRTVKDFDGFYLSLMREAVEFFKSGQSPISPAEMIQVVSIMEGANRSRAAGGVWIDLRS